MKTVNVGVVGLGFMGVTHLRAYQQIPGVRIAAICDAICLPEDGDFSKIKGNVGPADPLKLDMTGVKATRNMEDLLADPAIDLIDLCVPTLAHPKLAVAALKAGKHVVCEKPLARDVAAAREIVTAVDEAKGFFMPAMCIRFWPQWLWVKEAIRTQAYGRVLSARFRRVSEPPRWNPTFLDGAKSGGALLDLHVHDLDFVQYCFGAPKAVYATGYSLLSGAIDHVLAQYTVECGASVSAEGGWAMSEGFGFNMEYTVVFERGTVDYDLARGAEALKLFQPGQPSQVISLEGDGYVGELTHMIECIREGHAPTVVTARDAARAIQICEAEEESIRTGKIVPLVW